MGHTLWLHFGVDEHPFATYFDVHRGYGVLTHSHMISQIGGTIKKRGAKLQTPNSKIKRAAVSADDCFLQHAKGQPSAGCFLSG